MYKISEQAKLEDSLGTLNVEVGILMPYFLHPMKGRPEQTLGVNLSRGDIGSLQRVKQLAC
jgi:hypothetical protein